MRSRFPATTILSTLILWAGCAVARPPIRPQTAASQEPLRQVYREVDGRSLNAYVFSPAAPAASRPAPAILLFHGGGWVSGEAAWTFETARSFQRLGLVAFAIEYRLSEGKVTPIEQLANGGPDVMLLLSPAVDAADDGWFAKQLQGRASAREYSPVDHIPARLAPTVIVQGTEDNVTPLAGARRFCAAVSSQGGRCDLHVYPGVGHLLTRNLKEQERDFDPDLAMRADAIEKQEQFLRELWLKSRS